MPSFSGLQVKTDGHVHNDDWKPHTLQKAAKLLKLWLQEFSGLEGMNKIGAPPSKDECVVCWFSGLLKDAETSTNVVMFLMYLVANRR
jgi:hypothetical protein